ncbi:hypothetical protein [Bradyrhizobium sp. HKCCYLS20291]|uniref:hypothetical protein n=1 Tax=Bradyrhizobium sp. HKCCYLS20291 TaxID=3420766 RepID=UPI003EBA6A30
MLLLSTFTAVPALAQDGFFFESEPGAYQAMHPDRDVLNGGELTPAARMGMAQAFRAANASMPAASRHSHRPQQR